MSTTGNPTDDRTHRTCPVCGAAVAELEHSLGDHLNNSHRVERGAGITRRGP